MTVRRLRCAVVTCFSAAQPGFLDFSYRVKALHQVHDVTLVSNLALNIPEFDLPQLTIHQIDMPPGQSGWLRFLWRSYRWLKKQEWDIVVFLNSATAPLAGFYKQASTVVYWNEHPTHLAPRPTAFAPIRSPFRALLRHLMFKGARDCDLVMPIGEAHRNDLLNHGCKPERTKLIYMGVADSFRTPMPEFIPALRPIRLLYAGSISRERGRDVMLEALALANRSQPSPIATLKLIGATGDELEFCRRRGAELGISHCLEVLGRIPGQEIPQHMKRADVGICLWEDKPWYRFNPPTKLFEYLVAGLPVLASDIRTHTKYIQSNKNGLIFEYSPEGLAQAIIDLAGNLDRLSGMKRQAWQDGEQYLWSQIEPQFLRAIEQVAAS